MVGQKVSVGNEAVAGVVQPHLQIYVEQDFDDSQVDSFVILGFGLRELEDELLDLLPNPQVLIPVQIVREDFTNVVLNQNGRGFGLQDLK